MTGIIDSQVHMGPGGIDEMVAVMDALGIQSIMIDEHWSHGGDAGYMVGDGAFRAISPTAELASRAYPDRFSYVVRVDRRDPELGAVVRMARDAPHARALRIVPGLSAAETAAFSDGAYDEVFTAASSAGLPVFVFIPGNAQMVKRYAARFPDLRFVIDHCGMAFGAPPGSDVSAAFEEVERMAELPNVALKWCHASTVFGERSFPGVGLRPFLRRALNSFGAERVMWASDVTTNQMGESWAELLFGVVANGELSDDERRQVLGQSARNWLDWNMN